MLAPVQTFADLPPLLTACGYDRIFGSRILTALRAGGLHSETARFFVCTEGGAPTAAVMQSGGVLTVSASPRADVPALADLVRQGGISEVDTNEALCDALQALLGGSTEHSYYMVYTGAPIAQTIPGIRPGRPEEVFSVLQRSHEYYRAHLTFDAWLADWQCRLDRGLAELYQLEADGQIIGTGSITSEDDTTCALAAVAVVPEYRHRGFGSEITRFLVRRAMEKGKTPHLISGYDEVAELYRKVGFTAYGRWGELYV